MIIDFSEFQGRSDGDAGASRLEAKVALAVQALKSIAAAASETPPGQRGRMAQGAAEIDAALGEAIRAIHAAALDDEPDKPRVDTPGSPA